MGHLIFLFYILSFTLGFSVILISFLLWLKNRNKMLKLFVLCALSLTLILTEQMITAYALTNVVESSALKMLLRFVSAAGCSLLIYSLTQLVRMLIDKQISGRLLSGLIVYSLLPVAATLLYTIAGMQIVIWMASALLFLSILYNAVTLLVHLNRIHFGMIRGGIRNLIIISLLMFPILIADIFIEKIPMFGETFEFGLLSVFVFYTVFSAMSLYYIAKGFYVLMSRRSQPGHPVDLGEFHITNREKEIIDCLTAGLSYRQISEKLSISIPTVKTHVTNIYKKLGVQNKIELINAIKIH